MAEMSAFGMQRIALLGLLCKSLFTAIQEFRADTRKRLAVCGFYHTLWIHILPRFGKYTIRQELITLDDESAKVHRLVKVPNAELEAWDTEHDVLGNKVPRSVAGYDEDRGSDSLEKKES